MSRLLLIAILIENFRTHEFVECQEGRHRPLILSEVSSQLY